MPTPAAIPPAVGAFARVLGMCLPAIAAFAAWGGGAAVAATGDPMAFFESRIRPVLVEHCHGCHSAGAEKVRGGLKLDTREDFFKGGIDGPIVVPGEPGQSRLIRAVRHDEPGLHMPPPRAGGKKLPATVIADLVEWVKLGAPYPATPPGRRPVAVRPWALEPVRDPAPPVVRDAAWPATSVDRFVLARQEQEGLRPAPRADKATLIRRATFDLTGLPPTPAEVEAFEADVVPDAFARVVDRLLASRQYGEHWGRHWLDVVRYADTAGDTADYPLPEAWRYRNYVIDAFNADKPYDELVREQVAGDILARQGPRERYAERVSATGYLALSRRFGFDSENYHHLTIQDTIDTLGQSVLGLTLGCARCHDHKFDPVSMRDYYGLYGIFESTRYAFPGSEQKGRYRAMVPLVPVEESRPRWREFESRFAAAGVTPSAVLRSLDDLDGDFEMQRFAAGGSYGVLVPPWIYDGKVSVTQAAQSPFKNLHPFGSVGASVVAGNETYSIRQAVRPAPARGVIFVNLDFRIAGRNHTGGGRHRFLVGNLQGTPAVEVLLGTTNVTLLTGPAPLTLPLPKPGEWHNLQLTVDLGARRYSAAMGVPGQVATVPARSLPEGWAGGIGLVQLDSAEDRRARPGLEIDNIGVQDAPLAPVSTRSPAVPAGGVTVAGLNAELQSLAGGDGDCEAQQEDGVPAGRWHPGPNSGVRMTRAAQSPFRNLYPAGTLGVRLPATPAGAYNGLGHHLEKPWTADTSPVVHVGFDFRAAGGAEAGAGTWRFQIGHTHAKGAVELGIHSTQLFRLSGAVREAVAAVEPGAWHQVQLVLDLRARTYTGTLASRGSIQRFGGRFADGWDGTLDYLFIDSGGHVAGRKPALDADNAMVSGAPLAPLTAPEVAAGPGAAEPARRARIEELRRKLADAAAGEAARRRELDVQLAAGPVGLAYGVSEGTPRNARLQIRGEPDRPGAEVPRGFIEVLGGGGLPAGLPASGRLELARWLTRPENPLTARVMVNRIWLYHFGRGLVSTPNDFGARSQPPSHPELLDHLATRFVAGGWSIKSVHRLILLSATWQQAGGADGDHPAAAGLYAGFPRRRLGAEEIRDAILTVSGELDPAPGGPHPFPPSPSWGYTQHGPFSAVYEHDRRSVYLMVQRIKRHPFLALFDGADPNSSTAERRVTTVPTQALYFLNDPFVHAKALKCAGRLRAECADERGQLDRLSRLALGRPATEPELAEAAAFLAACRAELAAVGVAGGAVELQALAAQVRAVFGSNEFLHCD